MNFRFTKKKVAISLIISVVLGLIIAFFVYNFNSTIYGDVGLSLNKSLPIVISYFFITLIVSFVLIYLVYSLIENKSIKKNKK